MWFDSPTVMMLPGIDDSMIQELQRNELGNLPLLVQRLRRDEAATEKLLTRLIGGDLTREWIQVWLKLAGKFLHSTEHTQRCLINLCPGQVFSPFGQGFVK